MATQSRQSANLFLKSSELGLPQPLTRRRVLGGGASSLAREGLGESQFDEGTYTVVLFIYTYFVDGKFGRLRIHIEITGLQCTLSHPPPAPKGRLADSIRVLIDLILISLRSWGEGGRRGFD
jgi:hypothetical protein